MRPTIRQPRSVPAQDAVSAIASESRHGGKERGRAPQNQPLWRLVRTRPAPDRRWGPATSRHSGGYFRARPAVRDLGRTSWLLLGALGLSPRCSWTLGKMSGIVGPVLAGFWSHASHHRWSPGSSAARLEARLGRRCRPPRAARGRHPHRRARHRRARRAVGRDLLSRRLGARQGALVARRASASTRRGLRRRPSGTSSAVRPGRRRSSTASSAASRESRHSRSSSRSGCSRSSSC